MTSRERRLRPRWLVLGVFGVLGVVLLLVAVGLWRWLDRPGGFERAVEYLPADTLRVTYVDWAHVRAAAGGEALDAGSPPAKVEAFLDRAFEQDLAPGSAVGESTYVLRERYGFSPLDASWEVFGQSRAGQVAILRLDEDVDLAGVEQRLRRLGYDAPAGGAGSGGTWQGGADLVASIDPALTPIEQNVAVLPEERLVLLSDGASAVSAAAEVVTGAAPGLSVGALGDAAGDPVAATLWASDFACEDLSMGAASAEDQQLADQLVDDAGGVSPLTGLVIARQADDVIRVGMQFETSDQAEENLQPRVDLAAGEAPGQGGSFAERFRVTSGEQSGDSVVLELTPRPGADFVFSDITTGPVLFATC